MLHRRSLASCFLLLGVIVFAGGCNKSGATATPPPSPNPQAGQGPPDTGPFAAGRMVFAGSGCAKCHTAGGAQVGGPKGKMGGPDLGKVGADPEHTTEWLAAKIRDPQATKPQSRMPKHDEAKINETDMKALVEYLASLK